jgi:hypothetical protein
MNRIFLVTVILCFIYINSINAQGKFSGYMFGDYYYNILRDNGTLSNSASNSIAPGGTAMQAFQFRRIYLTYDNDISEQFTTRFRLEADQGAGTSTAPQSDALNGGKVGIFVKDAYLKWKNIFSGSDLIFGVQPTPANDVSEAVWGYRSLEKTITDLRGAVDTRDMGLSLKGKITGNGMLNYWVMIGNGAGTARPESDKFKRYYAHLQIKPAEKLQTTLYVDYKDAADILNSYTKSNVSNSTITTALFLGYSEPLNYSIGVEAYLQSASNAIKDTIQKSYCSKSALGFSIFGSCNIIPELAIIARYDNFNPSTDNKGKDPLVVTASVANGNLSRNYFIAGLSWKVDRNVSIMPNILYETYEAPAGRGEPDPSVTARVTVLYMFL